MGDGPAPLARGVSWPAHALVGELGVGLVLDDPWRGMVAALVALERVIEVGLESPVWRMPALEQLRALVAAALDAGPPSGA